MKSHFDQVVDLGEHDNSEIKRAVLPHTESKYERALRIYDQFLKLHPQAVDPPDIKSYKAFMEFYSKNMTPSEEKATELCTAFEEPYRLARESELDKIEKVPLPRRIMNAGLLTQNFLSSMHSNARRGFEKLMKAPDLRNLEPSSFAYINMQNEDP
ncbi:hypothetical protein V8E54_003214 [Elaphomyces granulatus]